MTNIRAEALAVLNRCESAEQYSNIALDTVLSRGDFSSADRGLLTALVYGVIEKRLTLDHAIASLSSRPVDEIDLSTRNLLRMGIYQMAFMDRIPDHAAVNETVDLATKRTKGFVNAVLRAFLRNEKKIPYPDALKDPVGYLSVRYSFLPALCERFLATFGFDRTESLFSAFCKQPPLTLRTNTLKVSRDELVERLQAAGFDAVSTPESTAGIHLPTAPVNSLPGFDAGVFFVQDEASQLCVEALDARRGMRVLDTCACPGSKSFGASIDMENAGEVISCDLHKNKLSLVERGAARLGIGIVSTQARDARDRNDEWGGAFDRVLCDVPCSGFGVFAKKPELRYKDPIGSDALPDIQLSIVDNASAYVKKGGLLVYSTCTLLPQENEHNVSRFLAAHPEFSLLRERTLTPDVDGTDGFYFAVLKKDADFRGGI